MLLNIVTKGAHSGEETSDRSERVNYTGPEEGSTKDETYGPGDS